MGTLTKLLSVASNEVGTKENPPNSNSVKYNDWYYGKRVSGPDYPWCMVFCQWVYSMASVWLPLRTASCTALMEEAKKKGFWDNMAYKPGDLIILAFNAKKTPQHCGIIEKVYPSYICTIEGNTSASSNDNGGCVMRRQRKYAQVIGVVRPRFEEEVERMTIDEFVNRLTPEQAYKLVEKAEAYAGRIKAPDWVRKEGNWQKMMDKKIITSDTPEMHIKRDELASILGRMGLLD